jgi:hypothetical protein
MQNEWEGAGVKAAAYMDDPARPTQLVLHVVNFNVYLGRKMDKVLRVPSLSVQIPLPGGMTPKGAKIIRLDDGKEQAVPVSVKAGKGLFTLQDVGVHTVCVIE